MVLYCIFVNYIVWYHFALHGLLLYCIVFHCIVWGCIEFHGIVHRVLCCIASDGISKYCMVLHVIAWYLMVFHCVIVLHTIYYGNTVYNYGNTEYYKLLHGIIYWMAIYEFDLYCMILYCVAWYYMWLCTISLHCIAVWQWAEHFRNTIYNNM